MHKKNRAAILLAAFAVSGGIARAELTALVQSFTTTAPGPGGGQFFELYTPTENSAGLTSFKGDINVASNTGIFRSDGPSIANIVRAGQSPGGAGGGTFSTFNTSNAMNSAGQVAFVSTLTGTTDGSTSGVYRGDGSVILRLARDKEAATAGGTYNTGFGVPFINSIGQAAFTANVTGTADGSTVGIYRSNGSSFGLMARDKQAAPGTGGGFFTTSMTLGALLDSGHAIFQAGLTGTTDSSTTGIFRNDGTGATAIVRDRQAEPGGGTYNFIGYTDANSKGDVSYLAGMNSAPDGASFGAFRSNGTSAVSIARTGQAAPGGGIINGLGSSMTIGSGGQVALIGFITSSPDGANRAILRGDGSSLESIVRDKQAAPGGGGGTFQGINFAAPSINATGTVAFAGFITGTAGGSTDDYGIFLADPQEMLTVARKGQSAFGSVINFVNFSGGSSKGSQGAFNDAGQVMFNITNNDGYKYIVRYTPEIHFRNAAGGNWDNYTNWTVGLKPQAVHDVFVDPPSPFGATINGPAGNVATKSLTIAGRNGGNAQLVLNGGGNIAVTNTITIGANGALSIQNGSHSGAAMTNAGSLTESVGASLTVASFFNSNYTSLAGAMSVSGALENDSTLYLNNGAAVTASSGLNNLGSMNMDNALLTGNLTNSFGAFLSGRGTVNGSLTNNGNLSLSGVLTLGGASTNAGAINVSTGQNLRLSGLQNSGAINLNGGALTTNFPVETDNNAGGAIQGGGGISTALRNVAGLINANGTQPLVITNFLGNQVGGQMRVADSSTLNISNSFTNSGLIFLDGPTATLTGAAITNPGSIRGAGMIGNTVVNAGTLRAEGGTLTVMNSANSNQSSAQIQVGADATLIYSQGLATNAGLINLSGGGFDNNNFSMNNTGRITGFGSFSAGTLTNNNLITFTGGFSTINATVINSATRQIRVAYNPALFTGNVTNNGIFKNTSTTITFAGTYTENGSYISDPADNFFSSANIGEAGAWVGGLGDRFFLTGDLINHSTNHTGWQTADALLSLLGGGNHSVSVTGDDLGKNFEGYIDNFAWGTLILGPGDHLKLEDGNAESGGALYVRALLLSGGVNQISNIIGDGMNLYYDLNNPANSYLGGQTYTLSGGGNLAPVPEPAAIALGICAGFLLTIRRRRQHVD